MPRTARASAGGTCYHVMNRGNARSDVFHDQVDYEAFVELIARACGRVEMRLLAFCAMPNHFHLVLWPHGDDDLGRWMQWLLTSHVRRHHRRHGTSGHVWQGRFKAFPVQQDVHLLPVLRYAEGNPLRAGLVSRAEDWPWSSLRFRRGKVRPEFLSPSPVELPRNWLQRVNQPQTQEELAALRRSVVRGRPFGEEGWARRTARRLGLESSLRPRGRPPKGRKK